MDCTFAETGLSELETIIREADFGRAFLPSRAEPDFSAWKFLQELAASPGFHLFALRQGPETMGFVSSLPGEGEATLDIGPMYVRPQHRGKGLGRLLVRELLKWAQASGVNRLHTRTWGTNTRSRRILDGQGFRLVREVPDARIDGDSTLYYELDVGSSVSSSGIP